jgi:hypothetical protein
MPSEGAAASATAARPAPAPEKPSLATGRNPVPADGSATAKTATAKTATAKTAAGTGDGQTAETPRDTATVQAAVDPFAGVPPLEANSPIKLQAISWAQLADKSIAVINNAVLHEGDNVEGYTVVKIRPDDVILRRSGRMWRATFSIR